jgi:hypothetical protein
VLLPTLATLAVAAAAVPLWTSPATGQPAPAQSAPSQGGFAREIDNPYFPLTPGTTNIYTGARDGKTALEIFEVTHLTKKILGVQTRVVHDRLFLNNSLAEDTLDWFAQDRAGTVWYFGEATRTLDPAGHVISTDGSFQAGVGGARQGIFMPAHPRVGATYQQEFFTGHAEDRFTILSLSATVKVPAGRFTKAMLTNEFTPLEPDVRSAKNYVRGIGTVREFDTRGGNEHLDLVAVVHGDD